ncbi:pupal cuticle protein-like [Uranotaenia lowii]|uniref:pupal cuticle protein-like n=1 Tax=Uranotaenia lowii TaxID=190385 RepID=UPI0024785175|nr:pupal cuticle protein-like [Uranotaenia lowii]
MAFRTITLAILLASAVLAAPQRGSARFGGGRSSADQSAIVLVNDFDLQPQGSYVYKYETSNGISASQTGSEQGLYANGYYSYLDEDGNRIEVTYLADEFGFQPQGAHLPREPPVPDHVLKSLEEIRAAATPDSGLDIATLDATISRLRATLG